MVVLRGDPALHVLPGEPHVVAFEAEAVGDVHGAPPHAGACILFLRVSEVFIESCLLECYQKGVDRLAAPHRVASHAVDNLGDRTVDLETVRHRVDILRHVLQGDGAWYSVRQGVVELDGDVFSDAISDVIRRGASRLGGGVASVTPPSSVTSSVTLRRTTHLVVEDKVAAGE